MSQQRRKGLVRELAHMTYPEAGAFFEGEVVAILPVGSTEPHGPHLPLDTDVTIASAQALRASERLAAEGVDVLLLPPLSYGLTNFTTGFAGGVTVRPGTLWALLEDVVCAMESQCVSRIVFSNGHLEPEHVKILRGVVLDHSEPRERRKAQVVFPDNTRRKWAQTLGEEFASGDCHAGRYESSIVLHADGDSVREGERAALPAKEIGLIEKMQAGVKTFVAMGADQAYCGDPSAGTAAEGDQLVERLSDMIVTTVRETWPELFG